MTIYKTVHQNVISLTNYYLSDFENPARSTPSRPHTARVQADDTALVSNCPHKLQNLLHLSSSFCSKYQVQLSPEKTKLQVMSTPRMAEKVYYQKMTSQIKLLETLIKFTEAAEHVGIESLPITGP